MMKTLQVLKHSREERFTASMRKVSSAPEDMSSGSVSKIPLSKDLVQDSRKTLDVNRREHIVS